MTAWPKVAVEGLTEQEALKEAPVIARVKLVVLLRGVPVTVIVWLPAGAEAVTVKVMTEVQVGEQFWFEIE